MSQIEYPFFKIAWKDDDVFESKRFVICHLQAQKGGKLPVL